MNTYVAVSPEELRIARELVEVAVEPMMLEALPPDFLADVRRERLAELIVDEYCRPLVVHHGLRPPPARPMRPTGTR